MNSMQILCFLKAAKNLNFTESAAEMFISQPAFSHNIAALEEEWGVELFVRSKKRKDMLLTPAGAVMYEGMKNLQEEYEALLQKAQSIHQGKTGILRIGIIGSGRIDERIVDIFEQFPKKHPGIEMQLRRGSNSELLQWLQNKVIDLYFALKIDVMDKEWLDYRVVFNMDSVLVMKAGHPLSKREGLSLIDFRNETFINVSAKESPPLNAMLKRECEKAGFVPKVLDAADINEQTLLLESGKGIAVVSVNNMMTFNPSMSTVRLDELHPLEFVVAWNRNNDNPCVSLYRSDYELID